MSEVNAICDKIMIISRGKLVASDTPENLMKLMQPVVHLNLSVRAERSAAEAVLSQLPEISRFEIRDSQEEGTLSVQVEYEHGAQLRDRVAMAFAEAKCLVVGLWEETASLEDIFLELTGPEEKSPSQIIAESESLTAGTETAASASETEIPVPADASAETEAEAETEGTEQSEGREKEGRHEGDL